LSERGIHADPPGQEDWGWYVGVSHGGEKIPARHQRECARIAWE
jgi:hypothetical protein